MAPKEAPNPDETGAAPAPETAAGTQTLARGLAVLSAVAAGATDVREIGAVLGTTRATTHRLVAFLRQTGWLRQDDARGYALGPKLIELGNLALDQVPLSVLARPHLALLGRQTTNTVHLGVLDGSEVFYLDKIPGTTGQEMRSRIGHRAPLACTATGKALMLDLNEDGWRLHYERAAAVARAAHPVPPGLLDWPAYRERMLEHVRDGYCTDIEENEVGIRSVSAPVRDGRGRITAGISVASTVPFMPLERLVTVAKPVMACAELISRELGWVPPPHSNV